MSLTSKEAVDDINKMFNDVFPHKIYWESVQQDRDVADSPWASFSVRHASAGQTSLGGIGSRNFTRNGTVIAAIFSPIGNGLSTAYELARVSSNAYEGKSSPNGVWFRNTRIQEIGRDGEYFQINMLVEFEYNETK